MSNPKSVIVGGQAREGTRVVLREITAMVHNSTTQSSPRWKNGNDNSTFSKPAAGEHEVKVRFVREFADVDSVTYSSPESLSSASSFYSISSTLSTKSSSGISADTIPNSPHLFEVANSSYVDSNIPGVEDLIRACADIHIDAASEAESPSFIYELNDSTHDQTFQSATDDSQLRVSNGNLETSLVECNLNETKRIDDALPSLDVTVSLPNCNSQISQEDTQEHLVVPDLPVEPSHLEVHSPPVEECIIEDRSIQEKNDQNLKESEIESVKLVLETSLVNSTHEVDLGKAETATVEDITSATDECKTIISNSNDNKVDLTNIDEDKTDLVNADEKNANAHINENKPDAEILDTSKGNDTDEHKTDSDNVDKNNEDIDRINGNKTDTDDIIREDIVASVDEYTTDIRETSADIIEEDKPIINQELPLLNIPTVESNDCNQQEEVIDISEPVHEQESIQLECTSDLPNPLFIENEKLQEEQLEVTYDLKNQESLEELDNTLTLTSDICMTLDSLNEVDKYEEFKPQRQSTSLTNENTICALADLELAAEEVADNILKSSLEFEDEPLTAPGIEIFQDPTTFDFLLARGNSQSTSCLRNESLYIKFDPLLANVSMLPQGNSQVFSTPPSGTIHKLDEIQEKNDEPIQVSKTDTKKVDDTDVTELELVRTTVLQLEKELEKQKKEYETELDKQKTVYQEKITKLQAQLSQEVENKNQLTVVIDEYEKSISRLLTEKERDRANLEQEKTKLQEELQATNHHLSNTEAAFNDVHLKYERLKGVVSAYKNNEGVLKESIQENLETIKSLENRYDQLKTHAMSQLRKANLELVDIRKQHEAETVKLHAMVRKAELKSNSLAEIVEQKTKENKELTQILDELIARVGRQNAE